MTVRVAGPRRCHGHAWSNGLDERLRCRGAAAVVCHLEKVDARQPRGEEGRVDALLDVAHQQDAPAPDVAAQDDGYVVDGGAAVGRVERDAARQRPQDTEVDLIDLQPVPRGKSEADRRCGFRQLSRPGRIARPRAAHPRLEDPYHPVSLEEQREARDMIFVRMTEDDDVDTTIPRRDPAI